MTPVPFYPGDGPDLTDPNTYPSQWDPAVAQQFATQLIPYHNPNLIPSPGMRIGPLRLSGSGLDAASLAVLSALQNGPRPQGFGQSFAAGLAGGLAQGRFNQAQGRAAANQSAMDAAAQDEKDRRAAAREFAMGLAKHRWSLQAQQDTGRQMFTLPDGTQIPMTAAVANGLATKQGVIPTPTAKTPPPKVDPATMDRLHRIAQGIKEGRLSPDLETYGRDTNVKVALADELLKIGVDPKHLSEQYLAEKAFLRSANGPVALRLTRNVMNTKNSIPVSRKLIGDVESAIPRGTVKIFNKATMVAALNGAYGPQASAAAAKLNMQLKGLALELSNVYQGGTAPYDNTIRALMDTLSSDWNVDALNGALDVAGIDLGVRIQAMRDVGPIGLGADNKPTNIPGLESDSNAVAPVAHTGNNAGKAFLDSLRTGRKK